MVEPLASGVLNSLLTGYTTLKHPHYLQAIGRTISKASESFVIPEFVLPSTSFAKGKQKELALEHKCSGGSSQCQEWSCRVSRYSNWCSGRHRVTMMQELDDRRRISKRNNLYRTARQRTQAAADIWAFSGVSRRQVSHATKAAQIYATQPYAEGSTPATKQIGDLQRLWEYSQSSPNQLNIYRVWNAYTAAEELGVLHSLTIEQHLNLVENILGAAEILYTDNAVGLAAIKEWGHRVQHMVHGCSQSLPEHVSYHLRHTCALSRSLALQGDIDQALEQLYSATKLTRTMDESVRQERLLRAYEGIILSLWRRHGAFEGLEFILEHWETLSPHIARHSRTKLPETPVRVGRSLRQTCFSMLIEMDNPRSRIFQSGWSNDNLVNAGSLLIEAFCSNDLGFEGYKIMMSMKKHRLWPYHNVQLLLVRTLAREGRFEDANTIYEAFIATKPFRYHTCTGLYLYARQGDSTRATQLFDELQERGWVSPYDIAQYMFSYAATGNVEMVVDIFDRFFSSDSPREFAVDTLHYTMVVYGYAQRGDMEGIQVWLERMSASGFAPDVGIYTTIIRSFALQADLEAMATVLEHMRSTGIKPTEVTYTTIISALAQCKDSAGAESMFKQALEEGIQPDRRMVNAMINAHVEAGRWDGVIRVFDYLKAVPKPRLRLSSESYNTLLKAYILIGSPFSVVSNIFLKMEETTGIRPDEYSYALLIQSACDSGLMDVAVDIYQELEKLDMDRRHKLVNVYVLTIIMAGFLRINDKIRAKEVYDSMKERGINPTNITFHAILKSYGTEGSAESLSIAESFIKSITTQDVQQHLWDKSTHSRKSPLDLIYSPIIGAYSRKDRIEDAERMFQEYIDVGGSPSLGITTKLMDGYRRAGDIDALRDLWPEAIQQGLRLSRGAEIFKEKPDRSPRLRAGVLSSALSIYIDALSLAGLHLEVAEAWQQVQEYGHAFDSHNWNHLAVALVRAGHVDQAFKVVDKVIIPLQLRAQEQSLERDPTPNTPLTPQSSNGSDNIPAEPPMHRSRNRATFVQASTSALSSRVELTSDEEPYDFTRPLHILHELSPSWFTWIPHAATLSTLLRALTQLRAGRLVRPISPDSHLLEENGQESEADEAVQAEVALADLYDKYPQTVRMVQEYELAERRRLGTRYHSAYSWK